MTELRWKSRRRRYHRYLQPRATPYRRYTHRRRATWIYRNSILCSGTFQSCTFKDPFKAKQLHKDLKELGEEGAIQVFEDELGNLYLGAVGPLQFEIVAQRFGDRIQG